MKLLLAFLVLFSVSAKAEDHFFGFGASVGQSTKPSYGIDYEHVSELCGYTDVAVYGNTKYFQPYASIGCQGKHVNLGIGVSATMLGHDDGSYETQFGIGPELGFMQDLSSTFYIKENNYFMDFHGNWFINSTFSVGLNL